MSFSLPSFMAHDPSMSLPQKTLRFVVSLAVSYAVYYFFAGHTGAILISLIIGWHEIGHWVILKLNGYGGRIQFMVIGAAVIIDEPERFSRAHRSLHMKVGFAGVGANLLMAIVGIFIHYRGFEGIGGAIASYSGIIAALNLLPFGFLDGGHMARAVFDSADEETDELIRDLALYFGVATLVLLTWAGAPVPLIGYAFVYGLRRAGRRDDPDAHSEPRSMSNDHSKLWVLLWTISFAGGLALSFNYSDAAIFG